MMFREELNFYVNNYGVSLTASALLTQPDDNLQADEFPTCGKIHNLYKVLRAC